MKRSHNARVIPLESFDPRLMKLLLRGASETIEIPLEERGHRYAFRFRIHQLRKAMKDANHEYWRQAYGCTVSVDNERKLVIVRPRDSLFTDAFAKVEGLSLSDLPHEVVEGEPESLGPDVDEGERLLADFLREQKRGG